MGDPAPGVSGLNATFRGWLKAGSPEGRHLADVLSSAGLALLIAEPLTLDILDNGVAKHDWRGAFGSGAIDASAQAVSFGLNSGLKYVFRKEGLGMRPLYGPCLADPSYDSYCGTFEVNNGMPGAHAELAWTSVGSAVAHRLWDHASPGSAYEIASLTLAAGTVATLRIVADKHTASQTAVGSGLGLAAGIAIPALAQALGLGYDHWSDPKLSHGYSIAPYIAPSSDGAMLGFSGTLP